MRTHCTHLEQIQLTSTKTHVCEECQQVGRYLGAPPPVPDLRASGLLRFLEEQARHQAFHGTKHPLVRSIEPGESWVWCYVDEVMPAEIGPGGAIEQ